jgi:hypothetical protein
LTVTAAFHLQSERNSGPWADVESLFPG